MRSTFNPACLFAARPTYFKPCSISDISSFIHRSGELRRTSDRAERRRRHAAVRWKNTATEQHGGRTRMRRNYV